MTIFRGPGGTGSASSDSDTTEFQEFLVQSQAARDAALAAQAAAEAAEAGAEAAASGVDIGVAAAAASATDAEGSAIAAASSASAVASSASTASTQATNAATSATSAAGYASNAATSETNAATSETNAAASAASASSSASSAASSASTATTQASNAAGSASAASASASAAATSETNAASSASAASTSASNAATSASNAASSATSAANSASAAAASAASINPADIVHISGTETITGAKTFSQTITGNSATNAGLKINQSGTAPAAHLVGTNNPGVLRLENTDTATTLGEAYGAVEFAGNDSSTNADGVRAQIRGIATGSTGQGGIEFGVKSGSSTVMLTPVQIISGGRSGGEDNGQLVASEINADYVNGQKIGHGWASMVSTDTTVDVDITELFTAGTSWNACLMRVEVVGLYDSGSSTYARLHKVWDQHIANGAAGFSLAGAVLTTSYNSDSTNFPAGAVNASRVATVVSASQVLLRFSNRTTPAAGSSTRFRYRVTLLRI